MNEEQWAVVDSYITDLLVAQDAALEAALESSADAGLPSINVTPNQGKLLMLLAKIQRARTILEIGTLGGYSTIWLARGLPPDGRLITLEVDAHHAEVARANIARAIVFGTPLEVVHAAGIIFHKGLPVFSALFFAGSAE